MHVVRHAVRMQRAEVKRGFDMSVGHFGHESHDHTSGMAKKTLRLAFFLTLFILLAQVLGGLLANSLALLSDAGHVITDLFALGLAWFATAQAERPANAHKTFGYHRIGILAAQINALTLLLVTVWIFWEAFGRFARPEPIQPLVMFFSASVGILVNLFIGFGLRKEGENLNTRAAALHVFGDVAASVGVVVAGLIILLTGWTYADPILSIAIALLIGMGALRLLRETTNILLEGAPHGLDMDALVQDIRGVTGVEDVHDLHVWCITNSMSALSCHVLLEETCENEHCSVLHDVEHVLKQKYSITHTTIQFEHSGHREHSCTMDSLYCCLETAQQNSTHSHDHGADCDHGHEEVMLKAGG